MLKRMAVAMCGLSLGLFGCPSADTGDLGDDGQSNGGQPGGGGGGISSIDRNVNVRPNSPTLFVVDVTLGITSYAGANTADGNLAPSTSIDALRVPGAFPLSAVAATVDRTGTLLLRATLPSLNFYRNAASVSGTPAPDRAIAGADTQFSDTSGDADGIAYDRANDRLFVRTRDRVLVFEGAKLSGNGNAAPTRVFSNADFVGGDSLALGPNGDLYIPDGNQTVRVIANAGQRSGAVTPDRVIFLSFFVTDNVYVDSADRLYVTDGDEIAVLDGASARNGTIDTFPTITLQGVAAINETGSATPEIDDMVVDSRGIGYVADRANAAIHVIDGIGTRSGLTQANRAIHGPAVKFNRPFAIFLWE